MRIREKFSVHECTSNHINKEYEIPQTYITKRHKNYKLRDAKRELAEQKYKKSHKKRKTKV